ncbi:gluconolactonase [Hahella sp. CCB-MM4]|uniref:SMP-30/gluconolactonase/LRE family protein n=1 Tax=Hahella sp. (strain CCB-MM4) TaxID=1926491 RepID=UPI000BDA8B44|nr:SMP-30/gluconolactonase/LRE family protein [Hahella sp. CCB-MM4]OZG73283.1 gluconolactonase [Hahella sp. CCB-MM4]
MGIISEETKKVGILIAIPIAIFVVYFLFSPSPIDPVAYEPPTPPEMSGPFAPNDLLTQSDLIGLGDIHGPEDVDEDPQGRIVAGLANGDIVRFDKSGKKEVLVNTGGRPLGLEFDAAGNLWIADAKNGLLRLSAENTLQVMATEADGIPFGFTDDLDIDQAGNVYFSDASSKWPIERYRWDAIEARPYGRLMRYSPTTDKVTVLLDNLYFANGVALSSQEDFVLVNETWRYRIVRYWIQGPKAGTHDIFIDNLPGIPDGISGNRRGTFWLALATPRNAQLDSIHPYPLLKKLIIKLPNFMQPQPVHYGFVLGLNEQGEVVSNLQDPSGEHVYEVTSVEEGQGHLLLGTLTGDRIGRLPLPVR